MFRQVAPDHFFVQLNLVRNNKLKNIQMKRINISYLIFLILSITAVHSQNKVGVNTENPEQLFHVDAKGNTVESRSATKADDVVITEEGNLVIGTTTPKDNKKLQVEGNLYISNNAIVNDVVTIDSLSHFTNIGVATSNPQAPIHIANTGNNPKFRLSDTSERDGYMLTADKNGNAYWEPLRPMSSVVSGNIKKDIAIYPNASGATYQDPYVVSDTLALPPGKWLIMANAQTRGNLHWNNSEFTMYFRLFVDYNAEGDISKNPTFVVTTSSTTDFNTANNNSRRLSNPQLMYVLDLPVPFDNSEKITAGDPRFLTKVWLQMISSGRYGVTTGEGSFFAIRIDRYNN